MTTDINFKYSRLDTKVKVKITCDVDMAKEVTKKRSCWIAHYKSWRPFLDSLNSLLGVGESLPCSNGVCPYGSDVDLRVKGLDPNPPCPIYLQAKSVIPTDIQIADMKEMVNLDDRDPDFWNNEINKCEIKL